MFRSIFVFGLLYVISPRKDGLRKMFTSLVYCGGVEYLPNSKNPGLFGPRNR